MTVRVNIRPFISELREWRQMNHLNQEQMAAALGVSKVTFGFVESLRKNAGPALKAKIVEMTGIPEETLFPAWQELLVGQHFFRGVDVEMSNEMLIKQAEREYARMLPSPKSPFQLAAEHELSETVDHLLTTIGPQRAKVIRMRLIDSELTRAAIGKQLNLSPSRIGQIENESFRRLRHPTRTRLIKDYLEPDGPPLPAKDWREKEHVSGYHLHLEDHGKWRVGERDFSILIRTPQTVPMQSQCQCQQ